MLPGDEIGLSSDDDAGNGHGEVGDDDDEVGDEGEDEGERDGVRKERKEEEEEEEEEAAAGQKERRTGTQRLLYRFSGGNDGYEIEKEGRKRRRRTLFAFCARARHNACRTLHLCIATLSFAPGLQGAVPLRRPSSTRIILCEMPIRMHPFALRSANGEPNPDGFPQACCVQTHYSPHLPPFASARTPFAEAQVEAEFAEMERLGLPTSLAHGSAYSQEAPYEVIAVASMAT